MPAIVSFCFALGVAAGHLAFQAVPHGAEGEELEPQWVQQRVDHFDPLSDGWWLQRVFSQNFTAEPSPIFINIGGEGTLEPSSATKGLPFELARRFGAHLVAVEHRFYGESLPASNSSLGVLRSLLSEAQALEDLAALVDRLNPERRSPVVAFGCSYAGSLAAQARLKYPHLFTGAVSSSSPVEAKADFWEYDAGVRAGMPPACADAAAATLAAVEGELLSLYDDGSAEAWEALEGRFEEFGCGKLASLGGALEEDDLISFFYVLGDAIASAVQYNRPLSQFAKSAPATHRGRLRGSESPAEPWLLDTVCEALEVSSRKGASQALVEAYRAVADRLNLKCDVSDIRGAGTDLTLGGGNPGAAQRLWFYQSCSAYNYWQTAAPHLPLRSPLIDVPWHLRTCEHLFPSGGKWEAVAAQAPQKTNLDFGGLSIASFAAASRIHFTNGGKDPWSALSIRRVPPGPPRTQEITAFVIAGGSHCSEWAPTAAGEPVHVRHGREAIAAAVSRWLEEDRTARRPLWVEALQ